MLKRVLAEVVPVLRFASRSGEEARFGQKADLQRQEVPEDPGHRDDNVDPRVG